MSHQSLDVTMRLEMCGIDHQHIIGIAGSSQSREYLVEHTHAAPADKAIIDRLVRTISSGGIAPAQSTPDDKDELA